MRLALLSVKLAERGARNGILARRSARVETASPRLAKKQLSCRSKRSGEAIGPDTPPQTGIRHWSTRLQTARTGANASG
jgi:hypothetical protein